MRLAWYTNAQPDFNQESTDFITKPLQTTIRLCAHKLARKTWQKEKRANQPPPDMSDINANTFDLFFSHLYVLWVY